VWYALACLPLQAKHTVRARPAYGLPVDQLARLTMHRYVPEMGLLIIGSQGHSYVDLFYVARYPTRTGSGYCGRAARLTSVAQPLAWVHAAQLGHRWPTRVRLPAGLGGTAPPGTGGRAHHPLG